ncbi:unnamed protein product [Didymodactylos carnosus]|uniref:Protein kinase domain-containing protein n=1 Tax=Didymodactylos carnosus TaxID=1234261 RepID=A0A814VRG0_9BILA|nr:unnamed protein product [Didymodactylos carnosus]CAF1360417.1 unnamed protein product [Didymodactylos carnosus]CAF3953254.1 unnamed protein product [Didymodactylos carnosus]CAF4170592.1 unnamed protein product [Didymodactylos carnosus]
MIEKITKQFYSEEGAKRAYRQLNSLMHLNHADSSIIQLLNVYTPNENFNMLNELYLVKNYVSYDLSQLVSRRYQLTEANIQMIIYCVLRALKYVHSAGIVNLKLKTSDIGIDNESNIYLLKTHSTPAWHSEYEGQYDRTSAPEAIMCDEKFCTEKYDIWSVGCIMAELLLYKPLFSTDHCIAYLKSIIEIMGTPGEQYLNELCMSDLRANIINNIGIKKKQDFQLLFPNLSAQGIDCLASLLEFDFRNRPTADQALRHPFFRFYHDPADEPVALPLNDENETHSLVEWKRIVWKRMRSFQQPPWLFENEEVDAQLLVGIRSNSLAA